MSWCSGWVRLLMPLVVAGSACAPSSHQERDMKLVETPGIDDVAAQLGVVQRCAGPGAVSGTIQQRCDVASDLPAREVAARVQSEFEAQGWVRVEDRQADELVSMRRPCAAGRCLLVVDDLGRGNYSIWTLAGP